MTKKAVETRDSIGPAESKHQTAFKNVEPCLQQAKLCEKFENYGPRHVFVFRNTKQRSRNRVPLFAIVGNEVLQYFKLFCSFGYRANYQSKSE